MSLPTIEQAQEFLRLVNVGRAAMDPPREPLEFLDFDAAWPGRPRNCLSARNVFNPAGYAVFGATVEALSDVTVVQVSAVPEAMGMRRASREEKTSSPNKPAYVLTDEILAVTDPFDRKEPLLRERLVEAGVVRP